MMGVLLHALAGMKILHVLLIVSKDLPSPLTT